MSGIQVVKIYRVAIFYGLTAASLLFLAMLLSWGAVSALAQSGDSSTAAPVILTEEQDRYALGRYLEILEDKEQSSKSEKEGKKEIDETKIPLFLSSGADLLVYTPGIPIREDLKRTSLPYEILYPPPNQA